MNRLRVSREVGSCSGGRGSQGRKGSRRNLYGWYEGINTKTGTGREKDFMEKEYTRFTEEGGTGRGDRKSLETRVLVSSERIGLKYYIDGGLGWVTGSVSVFQTNKTSNNIGVGGIVTNGTSNKLPLCYFFNHCIQNFSFSEQNITDLSSIL